MKVAIALRCTVSLLGSEAVSSLVQKERKIVIIYVGSLGIQTAMGMVISAHCKVFVSPPELDFLGE